MAITLPILRGLDGHRKMGKSLANYIGVGESADQQFGKTMSIPDDLMQEWFILLTDRPTGEIDVARSIRRGRHPMAAKKTLARDIVDLLPRGRRGDGRPGELGEAVLREEGPGQHPRGRDPGRRGCQCDGAAAAARGRRFL